MELFIQIKNGQPHEHPIVEENFRQAFPDIDTDNLPPEFARFERIPMPPAAIYEAVDGPVYQWFDGIVKDVWTVRPMTDAERLVKNEQLTVGAYGMRDFLRTVAQQKISDSTTDEARQAWTDYLAQLDAYVVVDPADPKIPPPPVVRPDGVVLSTSAPGSAPSVTG